MERDTRINVDCFDINYGCESKKRVSFHLASCNDSGYSTDSSTSSIGSQNTARSCSKSTSAESTITWRGRLRLNSTPCSHSKINHLKTPDVKAIPGPFLRSRTFSGCSLDDSDLNLSYSPRKRLDLSSCLKNSPSKSRFRVRPRSSSVSPRKAPRLEIHGKSPQKCRRSPRKFGKLPSKPDSHVVRKVSFKCDIDELLTKSEVDGENNSKYPGKTKRSPSKSAERNVSIECELDELINKSEIDVEDDCESPGKCPSLRRQTSLTTGVRRISLRHTNTLLLVMGRAEYLLPKMLSFLPDKSLIHVSQVNRKLREIILGTKLLRERRENYMKEAKKIREIIGKENIREKWVDPLIARITRSSPRKALQQLQNISATTKSSCVTIPLMDRFAKEGIKLKPGETQQKCVKCSSPAHFSDNKTKATCTRRLCQFVSCTRCSLEFHGECVNHRILLPQSKSPIPKLRASAWKKRLRRL